MNLKSLILVGVLALSGLSIANAKTYHFTLDKNAVAGKAQLTPGEYNLKVEGGNAVFTNERTDQQFTTPVKVDTANKKHDNTAVESTTEGGAEHIQAIELGGSNETLEFGE